MLPCCCCRSLFPARLLCEASLDQVVVRHHERAGEILAQLAEALNNRMSIIFSSISSSGSGSRRGEREKNEEDTTERGNAHF